MTTFKLIIQDKSSENKIFGGFEVSGHAMKRDTGKDILCAAISSACYMTANTITDILGIPADITISDGFMRVIVSDQSEKCEWLLEGLALHMEGLRQEYPRNIQIN